MTSWLRRLWLRVRGERRREPRLNAERTQILRRQWNAAARLARMTGTTPEELLDYRRADRILAGHR